MRCTPWKFNISANKIAIYAATVLGWSSFRRYSVSLASKSVIKAFSCSSLSFIIFWRLAIKASIRIPSNLLKVISPFHQQGRRTAHLEFSGLQFVSGFSFLVYKITNVIIHDICCKKRSKTKPVYFCRIKETIESVFRKLILKRAGPLCCIYILLPTKMLLSL